MDNVSVTITFDGMQQIVCLFVFNVPPTGKVIWGWGQSLKVLEASTPSLQGKLSLEIEGLIVSSMHSVWFWCFWLFLFSNKALD